MRVSVVQIERRHVKRRVRRIECEPREPRLLLACDPLAG